MAKVKTEPIDVCLTFDTTGSMYPCLTQVRRSVRATVHRLFHDLPCLRVAVIAHGDYCDKGNPYVTKALDFTDNEDRICDFVMDVEPTNGGDSPECYELVLNQARSLNWKSGTKKVVVMIGDDVPHGPTYYDNVKRIDWRNELKLLLEAGINVYGVHAMPGCRQHSRHFYEEIARTTGGHYLTLDQFSTVTDLIMAVCYRQDGTERLEVFEKEVIKGGRLSRNASIIFDTLMGRKARTVKAIASGLVPVPSGRFQVLDIDDDTPIGVFAESQGLTFKQGRGFYELTKPVVVQGYKEVVLMDKSTGDIYTGDAVRSLLGLPPATERRAGMREDVKLQPVTLDKYNVFIQSTSTNRKLIGGTRLLYEVDDWERKGSSDEA